MAKLIIHSGLDSSLRFLWFSMVKELRKSVHIGDRDGANDVGMSTETP